MKTITFYSYKGGVGRSMTLANVAWRLAAKGKRIGVLDLDLEAPGLSLVADFVSAPRTREGGLAAYLHRSDKEQAEDTQKLAERRGNIPRPEEMRDDGRGFGIGAYCHWIAPEAFTYPGVIAFLPVGGPSLDLSREIVKITQQRRVISIRDAFASLGCEYLLVDSRTGFNATSQIASVLYPDEIVMVLGLNSQNIKGTQTSILEFRETIRKAKQMSGTASKAAGELRDDMFYLLPSLVPAGEEERKQEALKDLRKALAECSIPADHILESMSLPYHPQLAVDDRPMILEGFGNFVAERYARISDWMISRNPDDPLTRLKKASELLKSSSDEERKSNANKALHLIGECYRIPPFRDDPTFLATYVEACTDGGFFVEAGEPIEQLLRIESEANRKAGGKGVPSIRSALLRNKSLRKSGASRPRRLPFLLRAKDELYTGDPTDVDRLYGEIKDAYEEAPIDIPGAIRFHQEVARTKPDFAASAATAIADFHAAHNKKERGNKVFSETYGAVSAALEKGTASRRDLALVLDQWAEFCHQFEDYAEADAKLAKALDYFDDDDKARCYIKRATVRGRQSDTPREAEIAFLRDVLEHEPHDKVVGVVKRLAQLYEEDDRDEPALELRKELLEIEPWDRRDGLLKVWRLQRKTDSGFDDTQEEEVRRWIEREPDNVYTVFTLIEMLFLRGKVADAADVCLKAAQRSVEAAALLPNAIAISASERPEDKVLRTFVLLLQEPAFSGHAQTFDALRRIHGMQGDWEAALSAALRCLDLAGNELRTERALNVSRILERLGRHDEAIKLLDQESEYHADDVGWPETAAEAYVRRAACAESPEIRQSMLNRALKILDEFEDATGPMQFDVILPLRYRILVQHLGDEESAWRDLGRKRSTIYRVKATEALMALAEAEHDLLVAGRRWDKAIELAEWAIRFSRDQKVWFNMLARKADLLFVAGKPESALEVLGRIGTRGINENTGPLFLKLRCQEALGLERPVEATLNRLRECQEPRPVEDMDLDELSDRIRIELRHEKLSDGVKQGLQGCLRWIEVKDVNSWVSRAQAAAAVYYQVFGTAEQVEQKLTRLGQIKYWYSWVAEFIHDLKIIGKLHPLQVSVEKIEARFPLDPNKPIPQPE